jgi:phosphatidate cytidylyltransferase
MSVESSPEEKKSRAGRDVPVSIAVAVGLIAVIVASLAFFKDLFLVVVAAAILIALWEMGRALAHNGTWLPIVPMGAGSVGMIAGAYYGGPDVLIVFLAATLLASILWRMPRGQDGFVRDVTATGFVLVYVPFLASFVALLLSEDDGIERVLTFIAVTVASDIGGFVAGVLLGRHPMAPVISPKKTWEGFAGGAAASLVAGVLLSTLMLGNTWWFGLIFGAAIFLTATLGDLVESLIKRDIGIKDMSSWLPGHGGFLDRLDSILPSAAVAFVAFRIFG